MNLNELFLIQDDYNSQYHLFTLYSTFYSCVNKKIKTNHDLKKYS